MRKFEVIEPISDTNMTPIVKVYTEQDIIDEYWEVWSSKMIQRHKLLMVTRENCIDDWIVVNWAAPIKNV